MAHSVQILTMWALHSTHAQSPKHCSYSAYSPPQHSAYLEVGTCVIRINPTHTHSTEHLSLTLNTEAENLQDVFTDHSVRCLYVIFLFKTSLFHWEWSKLRILSVFEEKKEWDWFWLSCFCKKSRRVFVTESSTFSNFYSLCLPLGFMFVTLCFLLAVL